MLVSEVIALVALRLDLDVDDYVPNVMISHINSGIARINNGFIKTLDPEAIKQLTIAGPTAKPSDFFGFVPSKRSYRVKINGYTIDLDYGAPSSVVIKYSTFKPLLTSISDTIPLPDYCAGELVDYVCIKINNDFEANVAQDVGLATSDEAALFAAKGGQ